MQHFTQIRITGPTGKTSQNVPSNLLFHFLCNILHTPPGTVLHEPFDECIGTQLNLYLDGMQRRGAPVAIVNYALHLFQILTEAVPASSGGSTPAPPPTAAPETSTAATFLFTLHGEGINQVGINAITSKELTSKTGVSHPK